MRRIRVVLALLAGIALTATFLAPAEATGGVATRHHNFFPARIALPDGFQPEGIAIGVAPVAFLGSRADGDIYAADLITGRGKVISQGPGTPSLGMKIAGRLLYVAGGSGGDGRVVDVVTGRVVRSYRFSTAAAPFVNDVVLTRGAAYFTDSAAARLYVVKIDRHGNPARTFATLPLRGAWRQLPDVNNANGIAATPDRKALLVVQSATGFLFRVNPSTGVATRVDLGGYLLEAGDGLLVRGRTLYAVQNRLNQIAVITLNGAGTRGRLTGTLTDDNFDVPTTVAAYGPFLYLPNARFSTPATPSTTYSINRVYAGLPG